MAITYTVSKPRGTVVTGDLVFFSADVRHRVAICVLEDKDSSGRVLQRTRLEFTDDTVPSFGAFAQGTNGGAFRNAVEAWLATLAGTGGTQT